MLAETGELSSLTLRAAARRVGIAATSIYLHFPDLESLTEAAIERAFDKFDAARNTAALGLTDPGAVLLARARAYCRFALDNPGLYRVIFDVERPASERGQASFRTLVQTIERCRAFLCACRSILRELGTPNYIGDNGQGLVLKLAINISLAVQMLAFAEGLLLAERAGIDRNRAVEVMTQSPIGSPMLKARAALVLDLPDEAWFDIGLMQKDVVLALDTARQLRIPLPSAATADEMPPPAAAPTPGRPGASLLRIIGPGWRGRTARRSLRAACRRPWLLPRSARPCGAVSCGAALP